MLPGEAAYGGTVIGASVPRSSLQADIVATSAMGAARRAAGSHQAPPYGATIRYRIVSTSFLAYTIVVGLL
jgi:hypothetical protein